MKKRGYLKRRGFTLIELVVVMALVTILAMLIVGGIVIARRSVIETTNRNNAKTTRTAVEKAFKNRAYPGLNFNNVLGYQDPVTSKYTIMDSLSLTPSQFTPTCKPNWTTNESYGVQYIGKNNVNFNQAELDTGLTGKDVIIRVYNHNCTSFIDNIGIP